MRFRAWRRCACAHGTDTETPDHSAKNGPRICRFRCRTHRHSGPESPRRKRSQGGTGTGPPTSDPKGVPPLYWPWATCTHKAEKFRGGVKKASPVQRIPQQISQGHSEAPPPSGFRFPLGNWRPRGGLTKRLPRAHEGFLCIPGMLANCLLFTFGIAIPKLPIVWEFGNNLADTSDPAQLPPPGGPTATRNGKHPPGPGEQ